jgi:hypothetical protein
VRAVMNTGGTGSERAARRRRLVAMVIVFAMVLAAGATLVAILLG